MRLALTPSCPYARPLDVPERLTAGTRSLNNRKGKNDMTSRTATISRKVIQIRGTAPSQPAQNSKPDETFVPPPGRSSGSGGSGAPAAPRGPLDGADPARALPEVGLEA